MYVTPPVLRPTHSCGGEKPCMVPPSPQALAALYAEYLAKREAGLIRRDMEFQDYFNVWRAERRPENLVGLDDGATSPGSHAMKMGLELISRPRVKLEGTIKTLVLLVDFPDRKHRPSRTPETFEQLLFSEGEFATGSMRDFYRKVSGFDPDAPHGIDVVGSVHGWFELPNPSTFYANNAHGMANSFPQNSQGMAVDAVQAARDAGVDLSEFDELNEGRVTALFIIHAGRGAEQTRRPEDIWSVKWVMPEGQSIDVGNDVFVDSFLTVPEDCNIGVCAHEWGHLAGQWADYYDTGDANSGRSSGLGNYCLMAGGSWGDGGLTPAFPNGMLRMFHDWIRADKVTSGGQTKTLKPAAEGGSVLLIHNEDTMDPPEYLIVEYRRRRGQDKTLPDEGIAVYVIDERIENVNNERKLAIEIVQADGLHELSDFFRPHQGDVNDLYPNGSERKINADTDPPLVLADGQPSGVKLEILGNAGDETMKVKIDFV